MHNLPEVSFPSCYNYKMEVDKSMLVLSTMLLMGLLLGFIGAGGAGSIIAILTIFFGVPIHTALGTSLLAMVFTSLSGTYSHFREHNTIISVGLATGLFGAIGGFAGSQLSYLIPEDSLKWLTASMLFLSSLLLAIRVFKGFGGLAETRPVIPAPNTAKFWAAAVGVGLITGILSGLFGIGSTPFIQIGLLTFFGLTIQQSAGTTMLVILPIALMGGFGYFTLGFIDLKLFIEVIGGTIIGSYIGAKFTTRLHLLVLKIAMISVPAAGGFILLLGH